MDIDFQNLMENFVVLLLNAVLPYKFDGLNFDGLTEKYQKRQIYRYTVFMQPMI